MSVEDYDDEDIDISQYEEEDSGPLFWSMKLTPNETQEIDQPAIEGYIVHVTNACFGADVKKQSRTVVMVNPSPKEEDTELAAPICVLRQGQNENHSLDLLFNESATITLKGQKPSVVYLTGYLQPPVETDELNPMQEDMTEEDIEQMLKMQKRQQMALDDEDEEEEEEPKLIDEDEVPEPPVKKQKTAKGAKATKNGSKQEEKKRKSPQQKPKNSPQQKPTPSPLSSDDKKDEETTTKKDKGKDDKKETKKKKNKDKKMRNMKGGIKWRDMKEGSGDSIKNGDKLKVYYVGQTEDKKVFDKCISGSGFEFNFGKGDVIKGWDIGLKGMKVGGKRKLVIPPKMAYGASGSPPSIPPNSTLTFTIELKGKE